MKTISCFSWLQFISILFALNFAISANADTITINADARGWIDSTGLNNGSSPDNNYVVGQNYNEYRNWFQFTLPAQFGNVQSAVLVLSTQLVDLKQSPSITYSVTSLADPFGFSDLGTGSFYGSKTYTAADNSTFGYIALNDSAINSLVAGGIFSVGGRVTSPTQFGPTSPAQLVFGYSQAMPSQLVITTAPVPAPAAAWLFTSGLIGLTGVARKRKAA